MNDAVCDSSSPALTGGQSAHTEDSGLARVRGYANGGNDPGHTDERGSPPKRRYSLDLAMQGDGLQAMADALYDIATDLLHGSFPGQRISGGFDVGYRAELVENDPRMTHERYVEELEAYLSARKDPS